MYLCWIGRVTGASMQELVLIHSVWTVYTHQFWAGKTQQSNDFGELHSSWSPVCIATDQPFASDLTSCLHEFWPAHGVGLDRQKSAISRLSKVSTKAGMIHRALHQDSRKYYTLHIPKQNLLQNFLRISTATHTTKRKYSKFDISCSFEGKTFRF